MPFRKDDNEPIKDAPRTVQLDETPQSAQAAGQQSHYTVLAPEERDPSGFVRPVRRSYIHIGEYDGPIDEHGKPTFRECGTITLMGQALAETYARDPAFYHSTFCVGCGTHHRVGKDGLFVWMSEDGRRDWRDVGNGAAPWKVGT